MPAAVATEFCIAAQWQRHSPHVCTEVFVSMQHAAKPFYLGAGGEEETLGTGHGPDLPILSKIEPSIVQDCAAYNDGPNTIAPGSVQIGPVEKCVFAVLSHSFTCARCTACSYALITWPVDASRYGTDLAVAWNESDSIATFAFRGSSSTEVPTAFLSPASQCAACLHSDIFMFCCAWLLKLLAVLQHFSNPALLTHSWL